MLSDRAYELDPACTQDTTTHDTTTQDSTTQDSTTMAATFNFELVSPERILLATEDAEQVQLPGAEGDFTVLAGHTPVISALRPGILEILVGGSRRRMFVRGGFAEVQPGSLTVLAQMAMEISEMDPSRIATELEIAEAEIVSAKDDETRRMAYFAVEQLKALQGVGGKA